MPAASAIASADRSSTFDRLERERFDCAVIGGGITGAGVAREATLRGLSVALVEAEDFSSGTSSRSSGSKRSVGLTFRSTLSPSSIRITFVRPSDPRGVTPPASVSACSTVIPGSYRNTPGRATAPVTYT